MPPDEERKVKTERRIKGNRFVGCHVELARGRIL